MLSALLSAALMLAAASADSCQLISGNYYCSEAKQVQFQNVGFSGSYNKVTAINGGSCSSETYDFSGPLSPFDEELSVHFRGPIKLHQFAAYTKSSSNSKRDLAGLEHHVHAREAKPVYVTDWESVTYYVTVDQNGNLMTATATASGTPATSPATSQPEAPAGSQGSVQSSPNSQDSVQSSQAPQGNVQSSQAPQDNVQSSQPPQGSSTSPASAAPSSSAGGIGGKAYNYNGQLDSSVTGPSVISSSAPAASGTAPAPSGAWSRDAYYNADQGTSDGLVFLNTLGGSGSGVFSYALGNSLSYCNANGVSAASDPQTLSSTTVPSNKEFIIFTDNKCSGDDCGFYREGIPAYHGFDGNEKIFLFEFEMPTDSGSGGFNFDMPSIWLLNAQIPRTLQYGNSDCSCWSSGCGELDLFEVLNSGNNRMVSTLHSKQNGSGAGSNQWFARPTSGTMKAAAIFDGTSITITVLDDNTDFSNSLDADTIKGWLSSTASQANYVSL